MDQSVDMVPRRVAWLVGLMVIVAVAAIAPAIASGATFFSGTLSLIGPNSCTNPSTPTWPYGGCAQSGFNNWNYVTLQKNTGDRVALGMRASSGTYIFFTYGAAANGHTYTLSKYDLGAPGYNAGFCGYYSGNSSSVSCSVSM